MDIFTLLIWLLVLLIVAALIYWVIGKLGLPEPIGKVAIVILVVVVVIILIMLLLQMTGVQSPRLSRLTTGGHTSLTALWPSIGFMYGQNVQMDFRFL